MRVLRVLTATTVVLSSLSACVPGSADIKDTAARYLTAEASQDCPALERLTLPTISDPCANLQDRAFRLSMMEQTSGWHIDRHDDDSAMARTTLAENVPVSLILQRLDGIWYVVPA